MVDLEYTLTCSFVKVCVTEMRVKVTIKTVFDKNHDLSLARYFLNLANCDWPWAFERIAQD